MAGGTAHGIGMEAPTSASSSRQRLVALAQGGLQATGRALSPYTIAGAEALVPGAARTCRPAWCCCPRSVTPPAIGDEVPVELRLTTAPGGPGRRGLTDFPDHADAVLLQDPRQRSPQPRSLARSRSVSCVGPAHPAEQRLDAAVLARRRRSRNTCIVSGMGHVGRHRPVAQVLGVRPRAQQPLDDGLHPLGARGVVLDDGVPVGAGHRQRQGDDRAGPVLAGRAVHQGRAVGLADVPQGGEHRVGPVDQVGQVERRDRVVDLHVGVRSTQGSASSGSSSGRTSRLVLARRPRATRGTASAGGCAPAGWSASGPGPSDSTSYSLRRSTTSVRPSSSSRSMSAGVRACRLSERSSRPAVISPPSLVGIPPTSRRLARPSSSIHIRRTRPSLRSPDHATRSAGPVAGEVEPAPGQHRQRGRDEGRPRRRRGGPRARRRARVARSPAARSSSRAGTRAGWPG